jgi:hypothetical protein
MMDLKLKNLEISKTFTSGRFYFNVAERTVHIPECKDVDVYCDEENEIFEIRIIGTHGIFLKNKEEAFKVAEYLNVKIWMYGSNDEVIEVKK